jgi:hypothetical protein
VLEGNPDLYGPFWIATTVVFILFLGGTISQYLAAIEEKPFVYDFRLLSGTLFRVSTSYPAAQKETGNVNAL